MTFIEYGNATWDEFKEVISKHKSLMLIPVGCLEEHGPHLPITTDNLIAKELARMIAEKTNVILGPDIIFGIARSTQGFPGTIEFSIETFQSLIFDIAYSFASQGVKKTVFFTWHGGETHRIALREACIKVLETIRKEKGLPQSLSKEQFGSLPELYIISGVRLFDGEITKKIMAILDSEPYHAAELETSLMLYLYPGLVKKEKIQDLNETRDFPEDQVIVRGDTWLKTGVMGDVRKSTAEKGEQIYKIFLETLISKINKIKEK